MKVVLRAFAGEATDFVVVGGLGFEISQVLLINGCSESMLVASSVKPLFPPVCIGM